MNKFQDMMEIIDVPADLEQRVLKAAEEQTTPRRSCKRIAIAALAVVLVVAMGVSVWAGGTRAKTVMGHSDGTRLSLEETNALLAKGLGNIPRNVRVPEAFSNGFAFDFDLIVESTAELDDGSTYDYLSCGGSYCRNGAIVQLSVTEALDWAQRSNQRKTIGDITVYYREQTRVNFWKDGVLWSVTEEEAAQMDDLPEEHTVNTNDRTVYWTADGARYSLISTDGLTSTDELLDMAAELINK